MNIFIKLFQKKSLKRVTLGFILLALFCHIKILMFNDITIEPISPHSNLELKTLGPISRPPVYLISYADGPEIYYKNQNALAQSVLNKGVDFMLNYRRSHIDKEFYEKHSKIFKQHKGAGYFLWKPYVILKTLKSAPENAIVIYADTAFICHGELQDLIALTDKHDIFVWNQHPHTVGDRNKRSTLAHLSCDTLECRQAPYIQGGFIMIRNTERSRNFIEKWLNAYAEDLATIDLPSTLPNHPEFKNYMYDESILGILSYLERQHIRILSNEDLKPYFYLHSRNTRNDLNASSTTLLPLMRKHITFIERIILNSLPILKLRELILKNCNTLSYNIKLRDFFLKTFKMFF